MSITRDRAAFLLGVVWTLAVHADVAEPLTAQVGVNTAEVFVGEPFHLQVQVSGSENPQKPDLSTLTDFAVEDLGGQQNSSRSVTIINGRMTETVRRGYNFTYQLTPQRAGDLTIPAISVSTDRGMVRTQPVTIHAKKPVETDEFKLRLHLSKDSCYVGESVVLTVTWYLGQNVRDFQFSLPVLKDDHFLVEDRNMNTSPGRELCQIILNDGKAVVEKGRGQLLGRTYDTVTFKKVLVPQHPGRVTIAPATVVCEVLAGYRKSRQPRAPFGSVFGDEFFDDFFSDSFFGRRNEVYNRVVVPSNQLTLDIRELPLNGRTANFAGHVGTYRVETSATPTDVSVGDPITLSIALSGPVVIEHVASPPLQQQTDLVRDFKITGEMADGEVSGSAKTFTQTVRVMRADVKEIPAIELPYFDPETREYRVARSEPIPLRVKTARIVTAEDAEGNELPTATARPLQAWASGIAHNYEGPRLLVDQRHGPAAWLRSPAWVFTLSTPPAVYLLLLSGFAFVRHCAADPQAVRQRHALARAKRFFQTAGITPDGTLRALQSYFADRLCFPGTAVTFADIRSRLEERGVDQVTLSALHELFETCEAGRYSGNASSDVDGTVLATQAVALLKQVERELK